MPGQLLCACARDIGWLVAMDLCGVLHARPLTAHRTWSLWQDPKLAWIRNFVESVNANSNTWVYPAEISAIVSFPLHSAFEESKKEIRIKEESYFSDEKMNGNTANLIFDDMRAGKKTLIKCFKDHPELYNTNMTNC